MWPEAAGAKFLLKQRERQIFVTRCFVARTSLFTVIYDLRPAIICFPPPTPLLRVTLTSSLFLSFFKPKKISTRGFDVISQTSFLPPVNNNKSNFSNIIKITRRQHLSCFVKSLRNHLTLPSPRSPSPSTHLQGARAQETLEKKWKETINTVETKRIKGDWFHGGRKRSVGRSVGRLKGGGRPSSSIRSQVEFEGRSQTATFFQRELKKIRLG